MDEQVLSSLISFLGAFGTPVRMRIAAAIVETPKTVEELSAELDLPITQVLKQLERMVTMGYVYRTRFGGLYAVDDVAIQTLIKATYTMPLPAPPPADHREKVLRNFMKDGRLVAIPAQLSKRMIVLRAVAERFSIDRRYTEKEVNVELNEIFDDHCSLRRALVDHGLFNRDNGIYVRVPESVSSLL